MNITYQHQHHATFASSGIGAAGMGSGGGGGGNSSRVIVHGHGYESEPKPMKEVGGGKKRKEISGKLGKEMMSDRRDDTRFYNELVTNLHSSSLQLSTKPESHQLYNLRLLPLTVERSAVLAQLEMQETYALEAAEVGYEEERERVEEEWKRGMEKVRERLMEGIEERRKRAREDKEGEGTGSDATGVDSQSRPHITRKLRNKLGGTSPPPTPLPAVSANGITPGAISNLPITSGPFLNPHSLSVDELPSPFPLPLTSTTSSSGAANANSTHHNPGGGPGGGRRRPKGSGTHQSQAIGGLGKSLIMLGQCKEMEIESDLGEIRRGNKRRRTAVMGSGKTAGMG